jgi:predicted enzyme related to lactoylglutathione lyase
MEIQQAWVTIATGDLARSIAFYRAIFAQAPSVELPEYAEFAIAGLKLGLYQPRTTEAPATPYPSLSLCLQVADLERAIAQLQTLGHAPPDGIIAASHGREVYAYDPDGHRLILYQPKN